MLAAGSVAASAFNFGFLNKKLRVVLVGTAARKSIESRHPVRIAELTTLESRAKRL